ncbi:hypothetical protein EG832_14740 [bacterium]|nr:hypothetical protein [bacterium]
MKKNGVSIVQINRFLLFLMVLLAAYEVVIAGNSQQVIATWAYTVGFGSLVISGLILIVIGFETFQRPLVVTIATIIPLAISLGLIADFFPAFAIYYLLFAIIGLLIVAATRVIDNTKKSVYFLVPIHGISGLIIFFAPIFLSYQNITELGFLWISVGGALIGLGGLVLSYLRTGKEILSQKTVFRLFPSLLFLTTLSFVLGFNSVH